MCDMLTDEKHALEHAIEHLNAGEIEPYLSIYAADVVVHGFPDEFAPDRSGLEAFHAAIDAAFPDAALRIEDVISEENRLALRYGFVGTHRGPFLGFEPTGRRVAVEGMTILVWHDGKVVERWQAFDDLGLLRQIGAMEPAPARA